MTVGSSFDVGAGFVYSAVDMETSGVDGSLSATLGDVALWVNENEVGCLETKQ